MGLWDFFGKSWAAVTNNYPHVHHYAASSLASGTLNASFKIPAQSSDWQKKAWTFYDIVPEVRLVVGYRSAALSRTRLEIVRTDGTETQVVDTPQSAALLEALFGGIENHGNALSRLAQHLTVVGETYNVIIERDGEQEWLIIPPDHMDFVGYSSSVGVDGGVVHRGSIGFENPLTGVKETIRFPSDSVRINIIRIWQPHPHRFWEADSPTRGAIPTLERISHYDSVEKAAARSRLVGGGVWFLPQEMSFPNPRKGLSKEDTFKEDLYEAMNTAIQNPDSAAAAAPIIVWAPGETIDKVKDPFRFWSDWDKAVNDLRDTEIRRYAAGQPLPTERITGISHLNHWTGWQLSEEDLKFDIAPLAQLICDSLTPWIVQPLLGEDHILAPNLTELVTRPNRTPEAIELFNVGGITKEELREASGFPSEPPSDNFIDQPGSAGELTDTNSPPEQPDPNTRFSVAELVAKDILCSSGKWLLTHTGRDQRRQLQAVPDSRRHMFCADADETVVAKVADRVKQKYDTSVPVDVYAAAEAYVCGLYRKKEPYSSAGLREAVRMVVT